MSTPANLSEAVANMLLDVQAVQFSFQKPFTWSSGWKSPIYCDSRLTISYPEIRSQITKGFIQLVQDHYPETEVVAGVATAGVPQAALIADQMKLPMLYVRAQAKGHGRENLIEGLVKKGQKAVLVEDIYSTGKSTIQAAQALRDAGIDVLGSVAILTYGFEFAKAQFEENNLPFHTLTDYTKLLVEVFKREGVSEETMASLHEWRKNPEKWQPQ